MAGVFTPACPIEVVGVEGDEATIPGNGIAPRAARLAALLARRALAAAEADEEEEAAAVPPVGEIAPAPGVKVAAALDFALTPELSAPVLVLLGFEPDLNKPVIVFPAEILALDTPAHILLPELDLVAVLLLLLVDGGVIGPTPCGNGEGLRPPDMPGISMSVPVLGNMLGLRYDVFPPIALPLPGGASLPPEIGFIFKKTILQSFQQRIAVDIGVVDGG